MKDGEHVIISLPQRSFITTSAAGYSEPASEST